jgi:hypothetical protein
MAVVWDDETETSIKSVVDKYVAATRSDAFATYEKDFAEAISIALSTGYRENRYEPKLVKGIEDVVNRLNRLSMRRHSPFEISTKSIFIHGNKSQVEFSYYGQRKQTEFGDLIFIVSVALNGKKYFEKMTVNQFKKDSLGSKGASWDISNRTAFPVVKIPNL